MKNASFIILSLLLIGVTLTSSCKKEEPHKDPYPMKIEYSFYTPDLRIERSGGREYGSFNFTSWWKSSPSVEDSLLTIGFYITLNPAQPRYDMVFSYWMWFNDEGIRLNVPINPDTNHGGGKQKDYFLYYLEYDAVAAHWDLDPNYDNYIMLTYLSDDKKVLEGEFSFRGIKRPEYITMPYIPADTMTYEGGKFRMEKLF